MMPNLPTDETMSDGGPIPPSDAIDETQGPPLAANAPGLNEVAVPLDALAMPGEGDALETPQVGDRISYSVDGHIVRLEGNRAIVEMESVNGTPLEPDEANEPEAAEVAPDNLDQLTADAQGMTQPTGGY